MKTSPPLFSLLMISSWLGNLVITVIAVYWALSHDGPLTPMTFLAMAVAILSGNLLPAAAIGLRLMYRRMELAAEATEADLTVRDALARSEEVLSRLDAAEAGLAKSTLLLRQIPAQLQERIQVWEQLLANAEELKLPMVSTQLELHGQDLDTIKEQLLVLQEALAKCGEAATDRSPATIDFGPLISALNGMDAKLESLKQSVEAWNVVTDDDWVDGVPTDASADHSTDLPDVEKSEADEADAAGVADEDTVAAVSAEIVPAATEVETAEAKQQKAAPVQQADLALEFCESGAVEPDIGPGAQLLVHAIIGIQNRLYIRGGGCGLDWQRGVEMQLVGIGEYKWQIDTLEHPLEVELWLNDNQRMQGERLHLLPGQRLHVKPVFPKN